LYSFFRGGNGEPLLPARNARDMPPLRTPIPAPRTGAPHSEVANRAVRRRVAVTRSTDLSALADTGPSPGEGGGSDPAGVLVGSVPSLPQNLAHANSKKSASSPGDRAKLRKPRKRMVSAGTPWHHFRPSPAGAPRGVRLRGVTATADSSGAQFARAPLTSSWASAALRREVSSGGPGGGLDMQSAAVRRDTFLPSATARHAMSRSVTMPSACDPCPPGSESRRSHFSINIFAISVRGVDARPQAGRAGLAHGGGLGLTGLHLAVSRRMVHLSAREGANRAGRSDRASVAPGCIPRRRAQPCSRGNHPIHRRWCPFRSALLHGARRRRYPPRATRRPPSGTTFPPSASPSGSRPP
jgi:hypothetical protein